MEGVSKVADLCQTINMLSPDGSNRRYALFSQVKPPNRWTLRYALRPTGSTPEAEAQPNPHRSPQSIPRAQHHRRPRQVVRNRRRLRDRRQVGTVHALRLLHRLQPRAHSTRAHASLRLCCGCRRQRAVAGDPSTTAFFHRIQQAIKGGLLDVAEQTASCLLTIDALNVSGLQLTLPLVGRGRVRAAPRFQWLIFAQLQTVLRAFIATRWTLSGRAAPSLTSCSKSVPASHRQQRRRRMLRRLRDSPNPYGACPQLTEGFQVHGSSIRARNEGAVYAADALVVPTANPNWPRLHTVPLVVACRWRVADGSAAQVQGALTDSDGNLVGRATANP